MAYISNRKIDFVNIDENGMLYVFDINDFVFEDPFPWRYKLYYPFEENEKSLLSILYDDITLEYKLSNRFKKYIENRKALYDEVSKKYLPMVNFILNSDFPQLTQKKLIEIIDINLNKLYPYD